MRHLNDNRAYRPQGRGFWRIGAYRWWHKRTFFDMPSSHGACISPPSSLEHSRCFGDDTKGADGAADLLEVLRDSPLEKLNFVFCSQIPPTAWLKLRGASWANLREAIFSRCLVLQTWLRCLASSLRLHVFFPNVKGHCHGCFFDSIWQHWQAKNVKFTVAKWSDLQKSFARGAATDCSPFIPTVPFWALQVLWQRHQRCRWGRRPAGSLAQLSPGDVVLLWMLSNSVRCVAEAARRQLDQFGRSKLRMVPRFANLVAMFGQFVETPCFFPMLSRLFLWQHLTTLKGQKCEIDSCKWSDLQKSLARGAATDCRPLSAQSSFGNSRCFGDDTKGADGAADLLEVLRDSPLEKLDFTGCSQIPSTAWQRVPSEAWPELHDARGIPEEELSRIVLGGAACLGRKFLACEVGPCIRFWEDKWAMGRNLIVLGYLSCYVVGFMRTHVKWKSICCHRLPLSSLMGYRLGNPFNLYTKLRWNGWNHCISLPWLSTWLVQSPQKNL